MDAAHFFCTPQPRHLAELRIETAQSPVSFSDPCVAGCKRRCLLPAFSPRKKMLLELHPFSSVPVPPPSLPTSVGFSASALSSPYAAAEAPTGGSEGGSDGSFAFLHSPEKPSAASAGSNNGGALHAFLASSERPLTPMGSVSGGGFGVSVPQPSLSPCPGGSSATGASEFLASPTPARTGSVGIGAFPVLRTGSPLAASITELSLAGSVVTAAATGGGLVSPPFVFSASRTSPPPSPHEPRDRTLWSRRLRSQQQPQIILPPRKAVATHEPSRCAAAPPVLTAKPFCALLASPPPAIKQETKKGILATGDASLSPSPTSPRSVVLPSKRERGVQASGVAGEGPTSPAACTGAAVVVRVTCSCGSEKEFCFHHSH